MKEGLVEWSLVTLFLALAAAGAVAVFGGELRAAFGVPAPPPAARTASPAPVTGPGTSP